MTAIIQSKKRAALTLMELLVVILIVALLAAAVTPIMRGRVEKAKWAEANTAAGMIRSAVKVRYSQTGTPIIGSLGDAAVLDALGIKVGDLTGSYFVASDYRIDDVNEQGIATVTVTGSLPKAPSGSRTLYPNGDWE